MPPAYILAAFWDLCRDIRFLYSALIAVIVVGAREGRRRGADFFRFLSPLFLWLGVDVAVSLDVVSTFVFGCFCFAAPVWLF